MEKINKYTDELNVEIFELEQKNKKLHMYVGMYYKKVKELEKIKRMLLGLYENSNDHVRYQIDNILDELSGTRRM